MSILLLETYEDDRTEVLYTSDNIFDVESKLNDFLQQKEDLTREDDYLFVDSHNRRVGIYISYESSENKVFQTEVSGITIGMHKTLKEAEDFVEKCKTGVGSDFDKDSINIRNIDSENKTILYKVKKDDKSDDIQTLIKTILMNDQLFNRLLVSEVNHEDYEKDLEDVEVDEDTKIVMLHTGVNAKRATEVLKKTKGDILNAILAISGNIL